MIHPIKMQVRFSKALFLCLCVSLWCVSCHRLLWVQHKLVIIASFIQKDVLKNLNFVDLYCQLFGKNSFVCDFHPFFIFFHFPQVFWKASPVVLKTFVPLCLAHVTSFMSFCSNLIDWLEVRETRVKVRKERNNVVEVTMGFGEKKKIPNN